MILKTEMEKETLSIKQTVNKEPSSYIALI